MGNCFSGRRGGRPLVEHGWKLDLAICMRKGLFRQGLHVAGPMRWKLVHTDQVTAKISYEANLIHPAAAWVRLHYRSVATSSGATTEWDYRVQLTTTRPNFGGLRWWFICPITGTRVRVLYLPFKGKTVFASRQASGLAYRSQRITTEERAVDLALRALKRLGIEDQNLLETPYCPKPKWMRWQTHARLVAIVRECRNVQLDYFARRWGGLWV